MSVGMWKASFVLRSTLTCKVSLWGPDCSRIQESVCKIYRNWCGTDPRDGALAPDVGDDSQQEIYASYGDGNRVDIDAGDVFKGKVYESPTCYPRGGQTANSKKEEGTSTAGGV